MTDEPIDAARRAEEARCAGLAAHYATIAQACIRRVEQGWGPSPYVSNNALMERADRALEKAWMLTKPFLVKSD